jgi:hypothetical protein
MREKVAKGRHGSDTKNVRLKCAFNDHGMLCDRMGTLSPSTKGDGPWYCRKHAHMVLHDGEDHAEPPNPEREPMSVVDERVNKIVPRLQGESEHDWSMRCREFVLAYVKRTAAQQYRQREPGED